MPKGARENQEIGERLNVTRRALGYATQAEFADALSATLPVSEQRWNAYERGRERVTVPVALALCAVFDLSLDWIYRGSRTSLPSSIRASIEAVEKADREGR